MWNASDMSPMLLVHIPHTNSTCILRRVNREWVPIGCQDFLVIASVSSSLSFWYPRSNPNTHANTHPHPHTQYRQTHARTHTKTQTHPQNTQTVTYKHEGNVEQKEVEYRSALPRLEDCPQSAPRKGHCAGDDGPRPPAHTHTHTQIHPRSQIHTYTHRHTRTTPTTKHTNGHIQT